MNSIRNKFNDLQELIKGNIDVVIIAETKIDAPFTTAQFLLDNYHHLFRLDINSKSGGKNNPFMLNVNLTYSTWTLFTLPFSSFIFKIFERRRIFSFLGY